MSFTGNYSLRINLRDFDGYQGYAEYNNFKVANEKVMILNPRNIEIFDNAEESNNTSQIVTIFVPVLIYNSCSSFCLTDRKLLPFFLRIRSNM